MALKDKKISDTGINQHGVISAPDQLTGTAAENKKVFDNLVRALVAQSVNGLIEELAGSGGAGEIGVSKIEGLEGKSVQEALVELSVRLDQRFETAGVASFNGRTGLVAPQSGDYTAAMVGAAPAGYGLGTVMGKWLDVTDDLSECYEGGFYCWNSKPINAPFDNGLMLNLSHTGPRKAQIAWLTSDGSCMQRTKYAGAWKEWEWLNPSMIEGEEYRTTERWNGKPVYAKCVSFTNTEAISGNVGVSVPHEISKFGQLVRAYGRSGIYPIPFFGSAGESSKFTAIGRVDATNITVANYNETWAANTKFTFDLYYTKSE